MNITHNKEKHLFEIEVDGETAQLEYMLYDGSIALTHTRVPEKIGGRGIGTALVKRAFAYAKENGLVIKPYCSFVVDFLNKNESYREQLKPSE